jgi:tetrapyrrole methylase family protein/MazG family protein
MKKYNLDEFIEIMKRLTADDGCPWDRVQTHDSLKKYVIEEGYEVVEAIENNDTANLCEELGDVLLQVVFHSILAEKDKEFTFDDVVDGVARKMLLRHPHIFGTETAQTSDDVINGWESIKKVEKGYTNNTQVLKAVPKAMPSLMRGQKLLSKASRFGYSENKEEINAETDDVINSLKALKNRENSTVENEMEIVGNILFGVLKICQNNKINADYALTKELEKFINRFDGFENGKARNQI